MFIYIYVCVYIIPHVSCQDPLLSGFMRSLFHRLRRALPSCTVPRDELYPGRGPTQGALGEDLLCLHLFRGKFDIYNDNKYL